MARRNIICVSIFHIGISTKVTEYLYHRLTRLHYGNEDYHCLGNIDTYSSILLLWRNTWSSHFVSSLAEIEEIARIVGIVGWLKSGFWCCWCCWGRGWNPPQIRNTKPNQNFIFPTRGGRKRSKEINSLIATIGGLGNPMLPNLVICILGPVKGSLQVLHDSAIPRMRPHGCLLVAHSDSQTNAESIEHSYEPEEMCTSCFLSVLSR